MYRNVGGYIAGAVKTYRDTAALHIRRGYKTEVYSYSDLWKWAKQFRTYILKNGIKQGDMLLIWGPNMPEWVIALVGCLISGVVVVPVSVHASPETVDTYIKQTKAAFLLKSKYIAEHPTVPIKGAFLEDCISTIRQLPETAPALVKPGDLAEIMYTSGTTGDPSGVMLSHRNILVGLEGLKRLIPPSREYRLLSILPLSHALEQLLGLFTVLHFGATLYYVPYVNPVTIVKGLRKYRITHLIVVPQLLKLMWDSIQYRAESEGKSNILRAGLSVASYLPFWVRRLLFGEIHRNLGGSLKMFGCAGAPLDEYVARNWEKLGIVVIEGYGTTETSAAVTANTLRDRKLGSVGKFIPGIDVKFDEDGEILTHGPNVTAGYFKNPRKTRESFTRDGYFRTGDIGHVAADGFVYLSGRKKFKIVTPSGEKVYPEDIERKLNEHPLVRESCVVGIRKREGEMVFAALILREKDAEPVDIVSSVNQQLESHQTILEYGLWPGDDFPRTRTLKIDRHAVHSWACETLGMDTGRGDEKETGGANVKRDPLVELLAVVCGVERSVIADDARLVVDLDVDSLRRVGIVSMVEEQMGVELPESAIDEKTTVAQLRNTIASSRKVTMEQTYTPWPLWPFVVEMREIARRAFFFPLMSLFSPRVVIEGQENIDIMTVPSILVFNHVGHNEPIFILKALPPKIRKKQAVLADSTSFRSPFRSFLMYFFAAGFPIERSGKSVKRSLELAADLVEKRWMILMSPEGRRSPDGRLQEFKGGTAVLAVETGVPVYPVKVIGYRDVYPEAGTYVDIPKKKGEVTVRFGKPIVFEHGTSYEEANNELEQVLRSM